MWDLPGPGLEPVSPALAGGFLTTAPPGKSPTTLGMRMQAACTIFPKDYYQKPLKEKNPGGLVCVGEKCQLCGNVPHVVPFPSAVFSVCVCVCERERERDRQTDRQTGRGVYVIASCG